METLEYLLEKFKRGTATKEEKQLLLDALSVNEQALKKLLESNFEYNVYKEIKVISTEQSETIFQQIRQKISPANDTMQQPKPGIFQLPVTTLKWLIAASVAGIIMIGGLYVINHSGPKIKNAIAVTKKPELKTISNSLEKAITTTLQDGSIVTLEPQSAISYYQPFDGVKRDISLTGKAYFKVAKDSSKPFTVYANGIATTALGTEFWVDTKLQSIAIKLVEGKVVVRSVTKDMAMHEVYLKPGEQVLVNKLTGTYAVSTFKTGAGINKRVNKKATNSIALSFSKTPLPEVFNKIGKRYNMVVKYNVNDLESLSFTGDFLINDSLQTILAIICNTNDLTFKNENGVVVISK